MEKRVLLSVSSFNSLSGFNGNGLALNGGAAYSGTELKLSDGSSNQSTSAFYTSPVPISRFSSDFSVHLSQASDSGFTFALQNEKPAATGGSGNGLGYAGIGQSAAIEFNIASGSSLTGLGTNGSIDASTDLAAAGIDFHSGDLFRVHVAYDGNTLMVSETDSATSASASQSYSADLVSLVGGSNAYMGFTAGTAAGGMLASVAGWDYTDMTGVPSMGVNIRRLGFDSGDKLFADAMKEPGFWSSNLVAPDNLLAPTPAPIDANGWPTTDAAIEIIKTTTDEGGTYSLSFTGQANVAPIPTETAVQIVNPSYDAGTNLTTAQVIVPNGSHELMLDFTNTRRVATDATATGITNVRLMRPIAAGSATSYAPSVTFTTPILNLLSNFSTLRYMDYSLTNNNSQVNWSDRTLPSQVQTNGKGGAWEYAVALANQTGKDMWINVPEMATDSYLKNLAQLIAYGSDGVNPYTGPMGSVVTAANPNPVPANGPTYAGLDPNLHVYVEYSNEVWNYSFKQYGQNLSAALSVVAAGNSPLNYDGDGSESDWVIRRTAERTVETSDVFRSVFGDSQMMSRIRPVYQWQYANSNETAAIGLQFINNYYSNGDGLQHVASPHPVNYYLWGGGGAWYGGLKNSTGTGDATVPNGGFATPTVSGYQANPSGSTWSFSGSAGIVANGSALGNPASTIGTQAAYLQAGGSFTQTINFSGGLADLSFAAASTGTATFSVSVDGNDVSAPWTLTSAYSPQNTLAFDTGLSAGPHTVQFTEINGTGSVLISNVGADTANAMYNSGVTNISSTIQSESSWAAAFGLHMASYEGGFTFGAGWVGTPLQIAANQDPRAEQAAIDQMNEFYASGGDLGMYYDTTNHIWALTLDITHQDTPKINAVKAVLSLPQVPLNFGAILPGVGQSITVSNSLPAYSGASGLYVLDAAAPGTYNVTLNGLQSGAEIEQFLLDGQPVAGLMTLPAAASGNSSPSLTFTIRTAGLHALLLTVSGSGTVTPNNPAGTLHISDGAGPAFPAAPLPPTNSFASGVSLSQVNLAWTPAVGTTGVWVERSTDDVHFTVVGTTNSSSYNDTLAAPSTSYDYRIVPYNSGGFGPPSSVIPGVTPGALIPAPWTDSDVGMPGVAGYANYDSSNATWTVAGGGFDIRNHSDTFNFLRQTLNGDGTIIADVASVGNTSVSAKAGVMFRASTSPGDAFVDLVVQAGGGIAMQTRSAAGMPTTTVNTSTHLVAPRWLKLVRAGNTFSGFYSSDGNTWISIGPAQTVSLPSTALVGLVATAHSNSRRSSSTFTNVAVGTPGSSVATSLGFVQGISNAVAGTSINPAVTVAIRDAGGNLLASDFSTVTLTLTGGTFASGGNVASATAANGIASFRNLVIDAAGQYTLTATDGSLTSAKSSSFSVTPAMASKLVFINQPGQTVAGIRINPSVTVAVKDAFGNVVTSDRSNVTLSLHGGTFANRATSITVAAINGLATFSSLILNKTGSYSFTASDGALPSIASIPFTVIPGAYSLATSTLTVSSTSLALGKTATITLQVRDALGNTLTTGGLSVAFRLAGYGTSSGTLSTVMDGHNARYTAVFTATHPGTARQLTALMNGRYITSLLPAILVT